jgi:hypothetical protein
MTNTYDIIIIIIASRSLLYDELIRKYWIPFLNYITNKNIKINIIFMFGNTTSYTDLNIPKENIYISNTSESYIPGILIKTIQTMDFVNKNFVYKHILRTNLSSFFILENLLKTCYKLPDTNLYAGIIGNHSNILFASGAGYWMSKDIVEKIIANKNNIDYNTLDDVAIGKLLSSIRITPLPRYDLDKNIFYNDDKKSSILNEIIANNHYHIRVKNTDNNINIDIMTFFTLQLYKN